VDIAFGAAVRHRGDRRGTGTGPRRFGRPDTALPDQDPHAVRRINGRELDVRSLRKHGMDRKLRRYGMQALLRHRAEYDALRVADAKRNGIHLCSIDVDGLLPYVFRLPHRRAERHAAAHLFEQLERLRSGVGFDVHRLTRFHASRPRQPRRKAAHAVAGHL
jgi:hypothetical protein